MISEAAEHAVVLLALRTLPVELSLDDVDRNGFGVVTTSEQVVHLNLVLGPTDGLLDRGDDLVLDLVPLVGGGAVDADLVRVESNTVDSVDVVEAHDRGLGVLGQFLLVVAEADLLERLEPATTEETSMNLFARYLRGHVVVTDVLVGVDLDADALDLGHSASFCLSGCADRATWMDWRTA